MPKDDDRPLEDSLPGVRLPESHRRSGSGSDRACQHDADAIIVRVWDCNSPTLFGVLYGIVVTVVRLVSGKLRRERDVSRTCG